MPRYVIDIRYKGTNYAGWQVQPNAVTVQSEVDKALQTMSKLEGVGAKIERIKEQ